MNSDAKNDRPEPPWLAVLRSHVESLRFGTVQIVVHEGRVVQIERAEKLRFDRPESASPANPAGSATQP
jgi:hypothetical protein